MRRSSRRTSDCSRPRTVSATISSARQEGHHRFCHACGIAAFGDGDVKEIGGAFVSVNVACLDDIMPEELAKLPIQYMDGRHDNWFQPPKVTSYL